MQGAAACELLPSMMLAVPGPPCRHHLAQDGLPPVPSVADWLPGQAAGAAAAEEGRGQAPASAVAGPAAGAEAGPSAAAAQQAAPAACQPPAADAVLELNVRGRPMSALRSALVQVPGSRLAALLGGAPQQQQQLLLDGQGRLFLPYDPACFELVLDGLHELQQLGQAQPLALPPASQHKQPTLQALVQQLGLQRVLPLAACSPAGLPPAGGAWSSLLQRTSSLQQMGQVARSASAASLGGMHAAGPPPLASPPLGVAQLPNLYALLAAKAEL
jgi:hypothetical protein